MGKVFKRKFLKTLPRTMKGTKSLDAPSSGRLSFKMERNIHLLDAASLAGAAAT